MTRGSAASAKEPTEIPEIGFCETKHRLLLDFVQAVKDIAELHEQQMRAVIDGEVDFTQLETLLHEAAQRKDLAKYALMAHADSHGC